MCILKYIIAVIVLYSVHGTLSKPVEHNNNEGRGIGSTVWGWLTYPFTWWRSSNDILPEPDVLTASTTHQPFDTIEIGKHNVTIWCNDQTCTTMRCDNLGCVNISCNIYDTNLNGECREYNTIVKPEEPTSQKPTDNTLKPAEQDKGSNTTTVNSVESTVATPSLTPESTSHQPLDERPLELEAVLSSSVTEAITDPKETIKLNN